MVELAVAEVRGFTAAEDDGIIDDSMIFGILGFNIEEVSLVWNNRAVKILAIPNLAVLTRLPLAIRNQGLHQLLVGIEELYSHAGVTGEVIPTFYPVSTR